MRVTPTAADGSPVHNEQVVPQHELDFLLELAVAYQRLASYPPAHPAAQSGAEKAIRKLERVLAERPVFTAGVTRDGFLVDDVHTETRNRVLSAFANKLHDEQIGALLFTRGISEPEVHAVLTTLVRGSSMEKTPLGLGVPEEIVWAHARLQPLTYDTLELTRAPLSAESVSGMEARGASRQLWLRLARAAMRGDGGSQEESDESGEGDGTMDDAALPTPAQIGAMLNAQRHDGPDTGRAAAGVLIRLTERARDSTDSEADLVGRYLSDLIGTLSEETLDRLMQAQDTPENRRRFLMAASEGLAADAMLALTRAAASASKVAISSPMLRMLGKIARGSTPGSEAESSLRSLVRETASLWTGTEGAPEEYEALLTGLGTGTPEIETLRGTMHYDPFSVVALGMELGTANEAVLAAADRMVIDGNVTVLFEALNAATDTATETAALIRTHVLRPELLYRFLRAPNVDFQTVHMYASAMGSAAAGPLLDLLGATADRALRARLLTLLSQLGADVGPYAIARMQGAPWFVQRNLLDLLGRLPALPAEASLSEPARHPDARVRRAAFKIILRDADRRGEGLIMALADADGDILRMALGAASENCPPAAFPLVRKVFENHSNEEDIRAMCLRVLAARKDPEILETLIRLAAGTRSLFRRDRLQPKSPLMLAALASLAVHWRDNERAARVLLSASSHSDQEIRSAAQATRRGNRT